MKLQEVENIKERARASAEEHRKARIAAHWNRLATDEKLQTVRDVFPVPERMIYDEEDNRRANHL